MRKSNNGFFQMGPVTYSQTGPNDVVHMIKQINQKDVGKQSSQPQIMCKIKEKMINATIDTGSSNSIMSKEIAKDICLPYHLPTNQLPHLQGVSGTKLQIVGISNTKVIIDGNEFNVEFIILDNINPNTILLGLEFLRSSKLVINFSNNMLSKADKSTTLQSKIFVDGDYEIRPFSSNIIFAKTTGETNEIRNQLTCSALNLTLQGKYAERLVYHVRNVTKDTIQLNNEEILGVSYSNKEDTSPQVRENLSPKDRTEIVFKSTKINDNKFLSTSHKSELKNIILENHTAFAITENDIGCIKDFEHSFEITDEQELVKGNKVYPVPLKLLEPAKVELARLEKLGVIEKTVSKFSIPSFFIAKKSIDDPKGSQNITKCRLLNDMRHLNKLITPEVTSIASAETLLSAFQTKQAKYFCVIDLKDAFYSMVLKNNCRKYTSFCIPGIGTYSYKKCPLGLANCPSSMSYVIQKILGGHRNTINYMDDILIYGINVDEIIQIFRSVLQILCNNGFRINYKKLQIIKTEVVFLGMKINEYGVKPIHDKVEAVKLLPYPTTRKACQALIGALNYYRRFIENFSAIARPLIDCIKIDKSENGKTKPFKLTDEAKQSVEKLKSALMKAPILKHPDASKKFYLTCDASQFAISGCLTQKYNEIHFPIGFFSRSLNSSQQNYCAFLRELVAIVQSIHHFKFFLEGSEFEVRTDSETLTKPKFLTKTQIRCALFWILELTSRFRFKITYIKGTENNLADVLSRIKSGELPPNDSKLLDKWFEDSFGSQLISSKEDPNTVGIIAQITNSGSEEDPIDDLQDTDGNFVKHQLEDKKLAYIRSMLDSGDNITSIPDTLEKYKRNWAFLVISNAGLVAIKRFDTARDKFTLKIVVPEALINEILEICHCAPTAGHMGYDKTIAKVTENFWFPKLNEITRAYCASCPTCHEANITGKPKQIAPLKFWSNGGAPSHVLSIDLWESGRHSTINKYILVIIDKFTRFVHFDILNNSRAPAIARALVRYMMREGIPNCILSDLGANLQGKVMTEIFNILKIKRLKTSTRYPMCNGASERSFKTITLMLKKFVSENPSTYPELLFILEYAINTTPNATTKVSPFLLQRGYKPRALSSLAWGITSTEYYKTQLHYCSELYKKITKVYGFALNNSREKELSLNESWSEKVNYTKYEPEQMVYYFEAVSGTIEHRKIRSPFKKAVIIKAYHSSDTYLIKLLHNQRKFICSYNKLTLIPYHLYRNKPGPPPDESEDDDPDLSSDQLDEQESEGEELSESEDFESCEEKTPSPRKLPRRSTRVRKAPDRYTDKR